MRAELTVNMDNAAFEDHAASELGRILRQAADRIEREGAGAFHALGLFDANGNKVGKLCIMDEV